MRLTKVLNKKLFYRYKKNNFSILEVHFLTKPQIDRLLFRPVMSIFASHRSPIQYVPHMRSVVYMCINPWLAKMHFNYFTTFICSTEELF